ncbi:MAG TPA: hypothetical protein VJ302_14045 [Blastocatellia bacterium]|nr:hypothetical protein [Blastocatellia bacterium]
MVWPSLPKYFIAHAAQDSDHSSDEVAPLAHVLDSFLTGDGRLNERGWVVATDCLGHLHLLPDSDRESFPASIQNELAFHELSAGGRTRQTRSIQASQVFLFHFELLEQLAGAPGFNDPVYLYGTLYGPCPEAPEGPSGEETRMIGIEGQLAVSRGDVMEALIQGTEYAFRYALPRDESGPAQRCFHLLLPGGGDEETTRGADLILAYPLLPVELRSAGVSNEFVVSQVIYDLLSAIKEDAIREQVEHPLRSMVLPVPSRSVLEQELQSQGYTINGDQAVKPKTGAGARGLLAAVFGPLINDRLELPPEGTVDEFLGLAGQALAAMPGWPPPRTTALRSRVRPAPSRLRLADRVPFSPAPPRIQPPNAPALPRVRTARPVQKARPGNEPPAWMQDFIAAHCRPESPPPKLTSTAAPKPPRGDRAKRGSAAVPPEWMKDFDQPSPPAQPPAEVKRKSSSGKPESPEWMDDFE